MPSTPCPFSIASSHFLLIFLTLDPRFLYSPLHGDQLLLLSGSLLFWKGPSGFSSLLSLFFNAGSLSFSFFLLLFSRSVFSPARGWRQSLRAVRAYWLVPSLCFHRRPFLRLDKEIYVSLGGSLLDFPPACNLWRNGTNALPKPSRPYALR